MKNKILTFLVILSVGIIITYPSFLTTYNFDSYSFLTSNYKEIAENFIQNNEFIKGLFAYFFNIVNLPMDSLSFVSSFLTNIFLSLSVLIVLNILNKNIETKNNLQKALLNVSTFLIFYNPLTLEIIISNFGFIKALGILLITLAARLFIKGKINYLWSFILSLLATFSFKESISLLLPLITLMMITKKESIKTILKKNGLAILLIVLNLVIIFSLSQIFNLNSIFNFKLNFNNIWGYINIIIYIIIILITLAISIYLNIKNKNFTSYIIIPCLLTILFSYLFGSQDAFSYIPLISLIAMLVICNLENEKIINYIFGFIILIMSLLTIYSLYTGAKNNIDRYKDDIKYIRTIDERIAWYESDSSVNIKNVYYHLDTDFNKYYDYGMNNNSSLRLFNNDEAAIKAIEFYSSYKIKVNKMSEEDYQKYFKNKNYDEFNNDQIISEDNNLYVLIY